MKKSFTKLFIVSVLIFGFNSARAQAFDEGKSIIHLGIGLGTALYGSAYTSTLPPISLSYEYGVTDKIGVGAYVGITGAKWEYTYSTYDGNFNPVTYTDTYKYSITIFGLRGNYHFGNNDKFDPYAGLMIGYYTVGSSYTTTDPNTTHTTTVSGGLGSAVAYSFHLGARYYLSDNIGIYGELGWGIAILNIGAAFKL